MMIRDTHPVLQEIAESPFEFVLVGSRYVGKFDRDTSDYDFLMLADGWYSKDGPKDWLEKHGFKDSHPNGYGPDQRVCGSSIWTKKADGHPSVDVIPVEPKEFELRLRFFKAMKDSGDRHGGLLAKALKADRAWPHLWDVIAMMPAHSLHEETDDAK